VNETTPRLPIQAVFFDAIGTLLTPNPAPADVYTEVGRRHGSELARAEIAQRFRQAFRAEEEKDFEAGWKVDAEREYLRWSNIVASVFQGTGAAGLANAIFLELWEHFAQPEAWRVDPDACAVLAEFSKHGNLLGIASNFDGRLHRLLDAMPELNLISKRILSAEVGWRKPDRRFFDAVIRAAECPPDRLMFIGDDPVNDYRPALEAGLRPILLAMESGRDVAEGRRVHKLRELLDFGSGRQGFD